MSRALLLLAFAASLGLVACNLADANVRGSGTAKTEARKVGAFTAITVAGAIDLEVTVGGRTTVEVTADDNIVPIIRTEVRGDRLVIDSRDSYSTRSRLVVRVTTPALAAVSASGSSDATITRATGERLRLDVSGSGSIIASGTTEQLDASVSGSGDVSARALTAARATVIVSGSGDVELTAKDALTATVSGSGSVVYWGNPAKVERVVSGSGSIDGH